MDLEPDELDQLLGEAMRSRPEATVRDGVDLAAMAIGRVRAGDARMVHLTQMGRRLRWCSLAAGLLVALVLAGGVYLYPASDSSNSTSSDNQSTVESGGQASVEASTTGSSSIDWTTLGLAALGLAVVGVAVRGVMVPERQGLRFAGA